MKRRRGIFLADAMLGLVIISMLAGVLAAALHWNGRAVEKLGDARAAVRLAERALAEMQLGRPAGGAAGALEKVNVRRLDTAAPAGMCWVEVGAQHREQKTTLLGLVPAKGVTP